MGLFCGKKRGWQYIARLEQVVDAPAAHLFIAVGQLGFDQLKIIEKP